MNNNDKLEANINEKVQEKMGKVNKKLKKLRIKILKTDEDVKMVLDPYRKAIIKTYLKAQTPMTVKQVADALDEVPAKVHYHVKKMIDYGILTLDRTENINGIVAKYYKPMYDQFRMDAKELSNDVYLSQRPILEQTFNDITDRFRKDLDKHMNLVRNSKDKVQRSIVANIHDLYMTAEEQQEVLEYFNKLEEQYSEPEDGKEQYSLLVTMARTK